MITRDEIKQIIADCCNDVCFTFNGKMSGVTSDVYNSVPTFQVWHGDEVKKYKNVEDVMTDKFYSGKSIDDLIGCVNFDIY